jgi:hypothetical protein
LTQNLLEIGSPRGILQALLAGIGVVQLKVRGWRFLVQHQSPRRSLDLAFFGSFRKETIISPGVVVHLHLGATAAASVTLLSDCVSVGFRALHGPEQSTVRGCAVKRQSDSFLPRAASWCLPQDNDNLHGPCRTLTYHTTVSCS